MDIFRPPAAIDDFQRRRARRDELSDGWSRSVSRWMDDATNNATEKGGQFYNPITDTSGQPAVKAIPWDAFPLVIAKWFENDASRDRRRWTVAEVLKPWPYGRRSVNGRPGDVVPVLHRQQDEYCEWFVRRNHDGTIDRIDFTCEPPEYWTYLAGGTEALFRGADDLPNPVQGDLSLVVDLYREYVDDSVREADLIWPYEVLQRAADGRWVVAHREGEYNPYNKWNTTHGAMHLTHPANSLSAEIQLASDASVVRKDGGSIVTQIDDLICCSGYGNPNRSSDPHIGADVNGLARAGASISLEDPIGLYIAECDVNAFSGPNGEDVADAWEIRRGVAGKALRACFGPSASTGLQVDEILARAEPIAYGGQIADAIQMVLFGQAKDRGTGIPTGRACTAKCCAQPEGRPVKTIVRATVDCSQADFDDSTPYTGEAQVAAVAAGAADESVELPTFGLHGRTRGYGV